MSNPIIEIKNIGKKYNITHQRGGYVTLRETIMNVLKSPLSFLKAKTKEEFWALKDISLNIQKGEVIGIIGKNGSGKSTLLKILSQITPPTTGEITLRGKIRSLLEVGTGFHPELTGRENIFLNGAILGMTKKEVVKKFNEIVEFSGIDKFLDTPVKYYSSGMYVRLAFSVAAHMESDILIVDEVLAVGDAEFQKKCLGKMKEMSTEAGRTIILVSHNMTAIEQMCSRVVLLEKGRATKIGPTIEIVNEYLDKFLEFGDGEITLTKKPGVDISFSKISITNEKNVITNNINYKENFYINLELDVFKETKDVDLGIYFKNSLNTDLVFSCLSDKSNGQLKTFKPGRYNFKVEFSGGFLMQGIYSIKISVHNPGILTIDSRDDVISFSILPPSGRPASRGGAGCVSIPNRWI
ncbi:MAG: ABC transporter ATP-binding protein [Candidatus Zambryskibacteria bacterium]|nr:ABC transporter ATP-binding protein [Candidatus Zambryskibacteria bacterium]